MGRRRWLLVALGWGIGEAVAVLQREARVDAEDIGGMRDEAEIKLLLDRLASRVRAVERACASR